MEKLAYLIFDEADRSGKELREALIDGVAPKLRAAGAQGILVNVADEDVAAGNPIRNRVPPVRAFVCFWLENSDDRGPCEEALGAVGQGLAGYLVAESRPLVHERRKGQRTEGMNQVTCIARKPGLTDEEFTTLEQETFATGLEPLQDHGAQRRHRHRQQPTILPVALR